VVGVDRKPPPTLAPDDPIAGALAGVEAREAPSRLLAIAAAAGLYGRVGRKPSIDSSSAPDPGPPESQAGCGIDAARRLRAILGGEQADLLPEWLELLAASGKRLPHDAIVEVLDRQPPPNLPAGLLVRALGVRGRWLASKNPAWRGFAGLEEDADPVAVWETGTRHERLAALRALRGRDPGRARDLATSTFGREPADDRAAHLGEFALGLSMDDEPFLESALDDRGKEVRRRAAELLRSLPGSRLCLRMIERARPLLAWEKVPSGLGRGSLIVEPPAGCDQAMIRDGVEPKPPAHLALGERAWWLREIISAVPTRSVSESLGVDAAEVVAANRGGEWEAVLWAAWASSSIRHRDDGWAEALLEASPTLPYPRKDPGLDFLLLAALASDRRDAHLVRRLRSDPGPLRPGHPALGLVRSLKGPVGVEAAREILNHVRPILAEERAEFADPGRREALREWSGHAIDPNYHDHQTAGMIADLGGVLPLDLADEAAADRIDDGPPRLYYASAYARTIDQLTFRRDMHREFAP